MPDDRQPSEPAFVELELPAGRPFDSVGRLVAAALGSRLDLPVDRIDDLQLAVRTILCTAPSGSTLTVTLMHTAEELYVEIGPFACGDAERRAIDRVVSPLVDELTTHGFERNVLIAFRVGYPLAAAAAS